MMTLETLDPTSPAELRAGCAYTGEKLYHLASRAGIHPDRLSRILNAKDRLTLEVGERILSVILESTQTAA